MDVVLLELILWVGLLFFFWALKEGLGRVEADINALSVANNGRGAARGDAFALPERVAQHIGNYRDQPIYRYVLIQGRPYQFDRVCPPEQQAAVGQDERCVAPGLVYQECHMPDEIFRQA